MPTSGQDAENSLKTILLVEDEALIALSEAQMLRKYRYEVITAGSAEKAIETVLKNDIDLILMDIDLGRNKMDGTEAAEIILKEHDIPIVFLSSHTEPEVVEKTEKITSYGYVVKNSSITVIDASIKMAFKLFDAKMREREKEEALRNSERSVRKKLQAILEPDGDISDLSLGDIIDSRALQTMLESYYRITNIPSAILEISGKVLVAVGWQDICTKFHRVQPDTLQNCLESDTLLTRGVPAGTFKTYRCRNNLWDMVTPIEIGGRHLGNIFIGQFLFDNEKPDYELFRTQARKYGFDEAEYMEAVGRIPLWSRDKVNTAMTFFAKLAEMIASLSYSKIHLLRTLFDKEKQIERVKESEEKYRLIDTASLDYIYSYDRDGRFTHASPSLVEFFGMSAEKIVGKTHRELGFPEEVCTEWDELHRKVYETNSTLIHEASAPNSSGGLRHYEVILNPLHGNDGTIVGISGVTRDVTDRMQAEEELKLNQYYLEKAQELGSIGTWDMNIKENKLIWTDENYRIFHMPLGAELTYDKFLNCVHPDDREYVDRRWKAALKNEAYDIEHRLLIEDKIKWVREKAELEFDKKGDAVRAIGFTQDITARKQNEEKIKNLLNEKEMLLKEVHHRVKNNMNIISSLLSMQSDMIDIPEADTAFREAIARIETMGVLYDKLYTTENYSDVSIKGYFEQLIDEIVRMFPGRQKVKIEAQIDDFAIGAKTIFSLGIIVNELFTNSMKYAFIGRDSGLIRISAEKKESHVKFIFADNGVGLPEPKRNEKKKGFGLAMIGLLVEQISGSYKIDRNNGTMFTFEFEL